MKNVEQSQITIFTEVNIIFVNFYIEHILHKIEKNYWGKKKKNPAKNTKTAQVNKITCIHNFSVK